MSCGDPHDLDCGEALRHLHEFLDGEVDRASADRIRQHFDECAPCLRELDVERIVKALVARSCCDHAPSQLRARVIAELVTSRTSVIGPAPLDPSRPPFEANPRHPGAQR